MDAPEIRKVWRHNMQEELAVLDAAMDEYPVVAVDTEFPGCIRRTPRQASEAVRYKDMLFNVGLTELIQLGLTLTDASGCVFVTWEFNFWFDLENDAYADDSIRFLQKNGIDFDELNKYGIERSGFATMLREVLCRHHDLTWVTFHGLYDMGYLLKMMKGCLPESTQDFSLSLAKGFGKVVDLKYCAKFFEELLVGELGLEKLGQLLLVQRAGDAHNAGSDSLLTAAAFHKMAALCDMDNPTIQGFLYGLSARISFPYW